ncbi:MAG: hypothetical protein QE164_02480 [Candidatus Nezhaarchaeota archaeon]|nr:hypothetical protein [Candidatus Nezhaarchaeota archaeon]
MKKVKTSIFVSEDLWREFKKHVASRDRELSEALEELIREELMVDLESAVQEVAGRLEVEVDFKPIKAVAPISMLVRGMRDEREGSILR